MERAKMNIEADRAGVAADRMASHRLAAGIVTLAALALAVAALLPAAASAAPSADLAITKTADHATYAPGDQITYTLRVENNGPDPTAATATDVLPAGVTFVSSGPGCSYASGPDTVTCNYSSLAPGGFGTQSFIVKIDPGYLPPPAPPVAPHVHQFTTDKVETHVDFDPGETRHETINCPAGLPVMTDGTVVVQHVDQGTGTIADVEISEARSSGLGSYEFTITNHATGRAQVKLFGVCLSNPSPVNGHAHPLLISNEMFGNTNFGTAGYHEAGIGCPAGTQPIAPGFKYLSTTGRLVKSEQMPLPGGATDWIFGVVLDTPGTVQASIRCMQTILPGGDHSHALLLQEIYRDISVAPGTQVHRLSCGTYNSDAKGIVATFEFDPRLTLAGTIPEPINRDFTFFNPTSGPLPAHIDLICLRSHTGPAQPPAQTASLTNTASVQGPLADPVGFNDSDSVTVVVSANGPPPPTPPQPGLKLASAKLAAGAHRPLDVKLACDATTACKGRIAIRAKVRSRHRRTWAVVARGKLAAAAGTSERLAVPLTRKGKRKLRSWRQNRSVIAKTTLAGGGSATSIKQRLRLRRR